MIITGSGTTDIGRKRTNNQDSILVDNAHGVFAVADGMGGHAAGEVASRVAIEALSEFVGKSRTALENAAVAEDPSDILRELARNAVISACSAVHRESSSDDPATSGMGTTLTALIYAGGTSVVAHVGDSRAYLFRDGVLHQLTSDHTVAADFARAGIIEPHEVKGHAYNHALTRVLGPQPAVDAEVLVVPLVAGDRFLLASDGLSEYVPDATWLAERLAAERPDELIDSLVAHANDSGGRDNISVVCLDVTTDAQAAALSEGVEAQTDALAGVPLFEGLSLADTTRVLNRSQVHDFDVGDSVFERGETRRGLIVVLSGTFHLTGESGEGRELSAGDYIGASTLVRPRPARRALRCSGMGRLLFLWRDEFNNLLQLRPWLGIELYTRLGSRLAADLERALTVSQAGGDDSPSSPEWF